VSAKLVHVVYTTIHSLILLWLNNFLTFLDEVFILLGVFADGENIRQGTDA